MTYRVLAWHGAALVCSFMLVHCAEGAVDTIVPPPVATDSDTVEIPHLDAWSASPHANASAPAFTEFVADGAVPVTCARCHSSEGYIDYLGGDGTAVGTVEKEAPPGSVVRCETCHAPAAAALTSVTFPSGAIVEDLGPEARCMVCHQGRASGSDIDASIAKVALATDDTASPDLAFSSIHYFPAAATLYAGIAKGGYQYATQTYDVRFRHVAGYNTCVGCHDAHSTAIKVDECSTCHTAVTDNASLRDIRMIASRNQDYDGDGNTGEGIAYEIQGLRDRLAVVIEKYGAERATRLCYSSAYPYWFVDTNGNDACDAGEAVSANKFQSWTPRLLRAAYNYQVAGTDPGNFAHNAKYTIELLYDSVIDLNSGLTTPTDVSRLVRTDQGHFNGAGLPARDWDADEGVSASCSRCHSGSEGFRFFTQYGVGKTVPEQDNGLDCATCHGSFAPDYTVDVPTKVYLADGKTTTFDPTPTDGDAGSDNKDNLCANCHIGRQNGATIEAAIAAAPPAGVASFVNVHYDFAAATRAGSTLGLGSQTPGNVYAGKLSHVGGNECTTCHDPVASNHTFKIADVWAGRCATCHGDASGADDIRPTSRPDDYDGDGNTLESLASELAGTGDRLLAAMRASVPSGTAPPCYDFEAYPYWFKDTNSSSPQCDVGETASANAFKPFSAVMLRAAHNYQISRKDPGAYAHNFSYVDELLFDSIVAVGGDTTGMTRP